MNTPPLSIVFALFDGMTLLDFAGPHAFLRRAPRAATILASHDGGLVKSEGLELGATVRLANVTVCDLLCVPGGPTVTEVALDRDFVAEIPPPRSRRALCDLRLHRVAHPRRGGSVVRKARGVPLGLARYPVGVRRHSPGRPGVRDGNVITAGGVTAGIDFALAAIAEIYGADVAEALQLGLEYDPKPPFDSGSPLSARPEILARVQATYGPRTEKRR